MRRSSGVGSFATGDISLPEGAVRPNAPTGNRGGGRVGEWAVLANRIVRFGTSTRHRR